MSYIERLKSNDATLTQLDFLNEVSFEYCIELAEALQQNNTDTHQLIYCEGKYIFDDTKENRDLVKSFE